MGARHYDADEWLDSGPPSSNATQIAHEILRQVEQDPAFDPEAFAFGRTTVQAIQGRIAALINFGLLERAGESSRLRLTASGRNALRARYLEVR